MSRPSFQFYHGDWISNAKLRRCTHEEKGVWIDILCLMADSDEFGIIRWPLKDLAQAVGAKPAVLQSLIRKGVLKGADSGSRCEVYEYVPRHARKPGEPVTLVAEQDGPLWYSSKQVRDDYIARIKAANARGSSSPSPSKGATSGAAPSSESVEQKSLPPTPSPSPPPDLKPIPTTSGASPPSLWSAGLAVLTSKGVADKAARDMLGKLRKEYGDELVLSACLDAQKQDVSDPIPWLTKACKARKTGFTKPRYAPEPDFSKVDYQAGVSPDGRF